MSDVRIIDEALVGLIGAESEGDVYEAVARAVGLLVPGAYVAVGKLSLDGEYFSVAETSGLEHLIRPLEKVFGLDLATATFPLGAMRPLDVATYRSGRLEEVDGGLYRLLLAQFPKAACAAAERLLGVTSVRVAGFAWDDMNYGMLIIGVRKGVEITRPEAIEMLVHQATIAIRRFRAEAELREKVAELDVFFTESPDLLCIAGLDGFFRELNPSWERALGYALSELKSRRFLDFVHPEDVAATEAAIAGLATGQEQLQFVNRYRTRDGAYRWLEWKAFPRDDLIYAAAHDLTDRIEAERALSESEARYRFIAENTADVIWVMDIASGRFTYVSPSVERLRGYTVAEVMEQPMEEVLTPESLALLNRDLPQLIAAIEGGDDSLRLNVAEMDQPRKDGGIVSTEVIGTLLAGPDGRVESVLGVSRDVTERKQAEAEIRALNQSLEARVHERTVQLEKAVAELEAFSYSVSHDLRAPLRAINGYATILSEDFAGAIGSDGGRLCAGIIANTRRMGELIDDLLALSRVGRSQLASEPIDMGELVRAVYAEISTECQRGAVAFSVGDVAPATGAPTLLRQVWANLLGNALKFSAAAEEPRIEVGCRHEGADCVYYVRDNGAGFDMRHAGKLFQVFERLHGGDYDGSGVGLAIVRRAVEAHHGRVWAEGKPGKGAAFFFSLPAGKEAK